MDSHSFPTEEAEGKEVGRKEQEGEKEGEHSRKFPSPRPFALPLPPPSLPTFLDTAVLIARMNETEGG